MQGAHSATRPAPADANLAGAFGGDAGPMYFTTVVRILSEEPMATSRSKTNTARTSTKNAGKPVDGGASRSRKVASAPSHEELDLRDRLKSGPRRPAGPPLTGDIMSRSAMDAMRNEVVPEPTEPRGRKGRK